jgi:hypothetical protein
MGDNRSTVDGALIKVVKDSGAIIIVRGNISQVRILVNLIYRVHYQCILKIEFGVLLKIPMTNLDLVVAALVETLGLSPPDVFLFQSVQISEEASASQPILMV